MRRLGTLLLTVVLSALACAAAQAACSVRAGEHVVLFSTTDDPQVFAWETKFRLREYNAASFDVAQALTPHADLVAPGTRALVVECVPSDVKSPYFTQPEDAVGVLILTGPFRGHTRWVLGSDIRPPHAAKEQR